MSEDLAWAIENMSSQDRSLRPLSSEIIHKSWEDALPLLLDIVRGNNTYRQEIAVGILYGFFRDYGLRHPDLVPVLVKAIESNINNDLLVSQEGIAFLADLKDPSAFDDFIRFIQADSDILRDGAVEGLGLLADARAISYLVKTLKDEIETIRSMASWALRRIVEQNPSDVELIKTELRKSESAEAVELLKQLENNQ